MPQPLDQAALNAYSDLHSACLTPAFDGSGVSFTKKTVRGKTYIYVTSKIGYTPLQRYLGPDNDATRALIAQEKAHWKKSEANRTTRAKLVEMVLAGGVPAPTPQEGKILRILERAGVFLAGGTLIGTPAFQCMGAMLGYQWEGQFSTRDLDIAADFRLPIALTERPIDLKKLLIESGMGFLEIPALNPKNPSTRYKIRGEEYTVELFTPLIGKPSGKPIKIPHLNSAAEPLRYLDYLIEEVQSTAIPYNVGLLVNVPDPARFALHKLVISQRRPTSQTAKSAKDINQAKQLLQVLLEVRPGSIILALEAANKMGIKFESTLKKAFKLLPVSLTNELDELYS